MVQFSETTNMVETWGQSGRAFSGRAPFSYQQDTQTMSRSQHSIYEHGVPFRLDETSCIHNARGSFHCFALRILSEVSKVWTWNLPPVDLLKIQYDVHISISCCSSSHWISVIFVFSRHWCKFNVSLMGWRPTKVFTKQFGTGPTCHFSILLNVKPGQASCSPVSFGAVHCWLFTWMLAETLSSQELDWDQRLWLHQWYEWGWTCKVGLQR